MTAPARFRQSDITRALRGAKKAGYQEVRVRIDLGGELEIICGPPGDHDPEPLELD